MSLSLQAACEASELARVPDQTMARHDDRDRVATVCRADRSRCLRFPKLLRNLPLGAGLAARNAEASFPYLSFESSATHVQWKREVVSLACEILVQLFFHA